jgi:hypothetical protein
VPGFSQLLGVSKNFQNFWNFLEFLEFLEVLQFSTFLGDVIGRRNSFSESRLPISIASNWSFTIFFQFQRLDYFESWGFAGKLGILFELPAGGFRLPDFGSNFWEFSRAIFVSDFAGGFDWKAGVPIELGGWIMASRMSTNFWRFSQADFSFGLSIAGGSGEKAGVPFRQPPRIFASTRTPRQTLNVSTGSVASTRRKNRNGFPA